MEEAGDIKENKMEKKELKNWRKTGKIYREMKKIKSVNNKRRLCVCGRSRGETLREIGERKKKINEKI